MKSNERNGEDAHITIYNNMVAYSNHYIAPCRASLIWLRYAECLNRLGKPRLAFNGFLKYGLCAYNLNLYQASFGEELTGESWMDFGQSNPEGELAEYFKSNNRGFHARGCGNTDMNTTYQMEEQPTLNDSIEWVETQLVNEYALETALEGNRFHDLMRIAKYRGSEAYLAEKVSAKFAGGEKQAVYARLLDKQNWYLPRNVGLGYYLTC